MPCPVCGAEATPPRCRDCRRPILAMYDDDELLRLRGVSHRYGSGAAAVTAVDQLDLTIHRGDITLVVGPSGGGKTTALLIMGLLLRPTTGEVSVAGQTMTNTSESDRARIRLLRLGFVFQQFNLLKALSAVDNVATPLRYAGVSAKHATARARRLLTDVGLGHRLEHRPLDLSGGEKQRVAVARALALGPQVIMADEPTANLDSAAGHKVTTQLVELARTQGSAIVIVTHDTRLAPIADRVLKLEDGRIAATDASGETGVADAD